MTFHEWMRQIDVILFSRFEVTSADLADACYRDMFEDELTPQEAAEEALANDDIGAMMLEELS